MQDWRAAGSPETAGSPGVQPVFHASVRYSDDRAMTTTAITPTSTRPERWHEPKQQLRVGIAADAITAAARALLTSGADR
jgi:hypothetical protein